MDRYLELVQSQKTNDTYHEKRQTVRRKQDGNIEFLKTIIRLAIRLNGIEAIKDVLSQGLDTLERGGRI